MEGSRALSWRKSSYSGNNGGNCVEVGSDAHAVVVRDTRQCERGPVLAFSPQAWRTFAAKIRQS
jgi:hypothetical protein